MKIKLLLAVSSFLAVIGFGGTASAVLIDCGVAGCIGGTYELDIISTGADTYQASYTIDTSVAFSVPAAFLNDIVFKVAKDYTNTMITSGPSGKTGDGPLAATGCKGKNDSFICIDLDPDLSVGGIYSWTVSFGSTAILAEGDRHLGARYTSADHLTGWIISESQRAVVPVPEPTGPLLFGAGLLVAGMATRREEV